MNLVPLYTVDLIAKDDKHFYAVNDSPNWLGGVTGVLGMISKAALVPWASKESVGYIERTLAKVQGFKLTPRFLERLFSRAKKQPHFVKETAARIGTFGHNVFDSIIKVEKDIPGPTPFLESFLYWMKTEKLRIVGGDTKVASLIYSYGGSLDVLLQDENGRYVIGDFKTGKYLYDTHAYQVAAYSQAFMETYGIDYRPEGIILRFVKDKPDYERREINDINTSFAGFKAALDLFNNDKMVQYKNRQLIKPKKEKTDGKVTRSVSKRQCQVLEN